MVAGSRADSCPQYPGLRAHQDQHSSRGGRRTGAALRGASAPCCSPGNGGDSALGRQQEVRVGLLGGARWEGGGACREDLARDSLASLPPGVAESGQQ